MGNHLTQDDNGTATAGLFNAVNEQTKRGASDVLYDARGNLTKDDSGQAYFYDRQNMLTRVNDNASSRVASYAYDALSRRIEKDVASGDVLRFYWDGWRTLEETDDAGTPDVRRYYIRSPGASGYIDDLLAFVDSTGMSDVTYFACRHHNFNVVALLNTSGGVVERYDYNPYGQRLVLDADHSADGDGTSDVGNPVGHQGLSHDDESGLVYNRYRYLNVTLGRWMQRDPLNYRNGATLYGYASGSPGRYVDPTGMESDIPGEEMQDVAKTALDVTADVAKGAASTEVGGTDTAARAPTKSGGVTSVNPEQVGNNKLRVSTGNNTGDYGNKADVKAQHWREKPTPASGESVGGSIARAAVENVVVAVALKPYDDYVAAGEAVGKELVQDKPLCKRINVWDNLSKAVPKEKRVFTYRASGIDYHVQVHRCGNNCCYTAIHTESKFFWTLLGWHDVNIEDLRYCK
ncbi:MAG: RHS repeat-associated core domain-containing protein [Phycisphaeraceae bacterium]